MSDDYFGKEDNGRYQAPAFTTRDGEAIGGKDLEARIVTAVSDRFRKRTLPMLHRYCEIPFDQDLRLALSAMCMDKQIRECSNGVVTAWFPYDVMPSKFWVGPDSTVEAEFESGFVPRDEEAKAIEMYSFSKADDDTPADETPTKTPGSRGRKRAFLDEAKLEDLATSCVNQQEIADGLGVSVSYLWLRLKDDADLKERFDGWRKEYRNIQEEKKTMAWSTAPAAVIEDHVETEVPEIDDDTIDAIEEMVESVEAVPKIRSKNYEASKPEKPPRFDLATIEQFAREGKTQKELAEHLGVALAVMKNSFNGPWKDDRIREAWERGRAACENLPKTSPNRRSDRPEKAKGVGRGNWNRKKIEIDGDRLESLAARFGSKAKVAAEFGIGLSSFDRKVVHVPEMYERFKAGKARFKAENSVSNVSAAKAAEIMRDRIGESTEKAGIFSPGPRARRDEIVRDVREIDDVPGVSDEITETVIDVVEAMMEEPEPEVVSSGEFAANVMSAMAEQAASNVKSRKHVTFGSGSQLLVAFDGNLFDLDPVERTFVEDVLQAFEGFERSQQQPKAVTMAFRISVDDAAEKLTKLHEQMQKISTEFYDGRPRQKERRGFFGRMFGRR